MSAATMPLKRTISCWLAVVLLKASYISTVQGFQLLTTNLAGMKVGTGRTAKLEATALFGKVVKTDEEWKEALSPEQYYVLREEGTEAPFSSSLNDVKAVASSSTGGGTFVCAGCNSPLFTTSRKYDSGTGWPSFDSPVDKDAIDFNTDYKLILPRVECHCSKCDGHLGHVFDDGPAQTTGQRFCINGISMNYVSDNDDSELATLVEERLSNPTKAYKPDMSQALPGAIFNGAIGAFFFAAFVSRIDEIMAGGFTMSTPLEIFPLLPAIFYGVLAANSIRRAL